MPSFNHYLKSNNTAMIKVKTNTGATVSCDGVIGTEDSGYWYFLVPFGTHTIQGVYSGITKTVSVSAPKLGCFETTIEYVPDGAIYYDGAVGGYGFKFQRFDNTSPGSIVATDVGTYIEIVASGSFEYWGSSWEVKFQKPRNTSYTTMHIEWEQVSGHYYRNNWLLSTSSSTGSGSSSQVYEGGDNSGTASPHQFTTTIDVSGVDSSYLYTYFNGAVSSSTGGCVIRIYKVWFS